MVDGNSLVNLGDLTKPATVLIEKISNAVGILYEPRRIRKKAEAEAEADKIKAIANIELTQIQQRGLERLIYQEAKKQENIETITAQAIKVLPESANTENLEEDWIRHFFNKCENISDKEMQSLWSNLLANEANTPGTYSKRTIDLIASMDKKDAELFTSLCQFGWIIGSPAILIFDVKNEIYVKNGITFSALKHLDSIGLISFEPLSGYNRGGFPKEFLIRYFDKVLRAEFVNNDDNKFKLGSVLLTKSGVELFDICGATMNSEFFDYAKSQLTSQGITLTDSSE